MTETSAVIISLILLFAGVFGTVALIRWLYGALVTKTLAALSGWKFWVMVFIWVVTLFWFGWAISAIIAWLMMKILAPYVPA